MSPDRSLSRRITPIVPRAIPRGEAWKSWIISPMYSRESQLTTLALHLGPITLGVVVEDATVHETYPARRYSRFHHVLREGRLNVNADLNTEDWLLGPAGSYDDGWLTFGLYVGPWFFAASIWTKRMPFEKHE